jgi:nucleotide-binding universal stress UspA family protein
LNPKTYIVTHDFTSVAEAAAKHAVELARQTKAKVMLLHIVKSDSEKAEALKKLEAEKAKLNLSATDPIVGVRVVAGSIFTDIAKVAKEENASFIMMGTHGAKGMQKVFGSFAIKVITSTDIPFIVVQDKVPADKIRTIVFPVDLTFESLQILNFAAMIAAEFDSEIHLVAVHETDRDLARKISNHIEVVKKQLNKKQVKFSIHLLEKSGNFQNMVINYAKEKNAEMIAMAYHSERLLPQFDPFAQTLITNDLKLPVMILNAKESGNLYF